MKILFVTNSFGIGGAERVLLSLAQFFSRKGHDVTVFSRLSSHKPIETFNCRMKLAKNTNHIQYILSIRKEILEFKPDIIIAFQYYNSMCAILANLLSTRGRIIVSERTDPSLIKSTSIKGRLRNWLYSKANILVCQTNDAKQYFPLQVRNKTVVIPNPLKEDLPLYSSDNDREKTIVTFGRLVKEKNFDLLIEAFDMFLKRHANYQLNIFGDGYEKDHMEELIMSKGLNHKIMIFPACVDIHSKVMTSSMYVSSSNYEGLSNSMIEAMAIGLPVVCTDCPCGGAKMIIKDGVNGLLVPVNDAQAMCAAMCKIVENPKLSRKISIEAQKVRDCLNINVIASKWEELF